jgi:hypothetical protein
VRNQRGNVIAIVLLLLAVVSIAAVGSLVITRYEIKFTTAAQSYDRGFNLADGAVVSAFADLKNKNREIQTKPTLLPTDTAYAPAITIGCPCFDWSQCKDDTTRKSCTKCIDSNAGDYLVQVQLLSYSTAPQMAYGWDPSSYYCQYWAGYGTSNPTYDTKAYNAAVETDVQKFEAK